MVNRALVAAALAGCATAPPRTDFARAPSAPVVMDRTRSDPRALAIADRVYAAAGGAHWIDARQLAWTETTGDAVRDQLWDRWNGRYRTRIHGASVCAMHRGSCSARDAESYDVVTLFEIYGTNLVTWGLDGDTVFAIDKVVEAHTDPRAAWSEATALLCLPFLVRDPAARLAYAGTIYDAGQQYERLRLAFAETDPTRADLAFELDVDAHDTIARATIATHGHMAMYELRDRATVAGLSIATTRVDVGTGAVTRITGLAIGTAIDEDALTEPFVLHDRRKRGPTGRTPD